MCKTLIAVQVLLLFTRVNAGDVRIALESNSPGTIEIYFGITDLEQTSRISNAFLDESQFSSVSVDVRYHEQQKFVPKFLSDDVRLSVPPEQHRFQPRNSIVGAGRHFQIPVYKVDQPYDLRISVLNRMFLKGTEAEMEAEWYRPQSLLPAIHSLPINVRVDHNRVVEVCNGNLLIPKPPQPDSKSPWAISLSLPDSQKSDEKLHVHPDSPMHFEIIAENVTPSTVTVFNDSFGSGAEFRIGCITIFDKMGHPLARLDDLPIFSMGRGGSRPIHVPPGGLLFFEIRLGNWQRGILKPDSLDFQELLPGQYQLQAELWSNLTRRPSEESADNTVVATSPITSILLE